MHCPTQNRGKCISYLLKPEAPEFAHGSMRTSTLLLRGGQEINPTAISINAPKFAKVSSEARICLAQFAMRLRPLSYFHLFIHQLPHHPPQCATGLGMASFVLAMSPLVVSHPIHSIFVLHLPPRNFANKSFSPVLAGKGKGGVQRLRNSNAAF